MADNTDRIHCAQCGHRCKQPNVWAIGQLETILSGIDKDESESADGWWETSAGADFGKVKLKEVQALIRQMARGM